MNTSVVQHTKNDLSSSSSRPDETVPSRITDAETKFGKTDREWTRSTEAAGSAPDQVMTDVLDPDDSLMKKFQDALRTHLIRVDDRLSSEISELDARVRSIEKKHEAETLQLYHDQQEIAQQQTAIDKYQSMITNVISLREEKDSHVREAKDVHRATRVKLSDEKRKEENLLHELEQLAALQAQFSQWQTELANDLAVSKRVSDKDKTVQRELIAQKQYKDCIIFKLMEEVWRVKTEIAGLDVQLQLKNKEKMEISRMMGDVNADLEALHRQHVNLCDAWNSVVSNIAKRNRVYEQLNAEREKIYESFNTLRTEMEMLKRETRKETENNENLTSVHVRIEDSIQTNTKQMETDSDRLDHLQLELVKTAKFNEQEQREFDSVNREWQCSLHEEGEIDVEFHKFLYQRNQLENSIYRELEEKITHDKAARYLNKLLSDSKDTTQEQELLLVKTENSYGSKLLESEQLNSLVSHERTGLEELVRANIAKGQEMDEIQKEIEKHETAIERKRIKFTALNKIIDEMLLHTGGEEISLLDMEVITLEKNLEETERDNRKAQQLWIRRQGHMITLSRQRDSQLRELGLLNKEIMIMDQKNLKLEHALETLDKEESTIERTLNLLRHRAMQTSSQFMVQKELKEQLEDKTSLARTEGSQCLREAELNLIKLQSELKQSYEEKVSLRDDLDAVQRESLSWEKKVQLMQETMKKLKEERSTGGEIATMKNEIHKMEMRLSHLRRIQEKLIHDMESCVARRDIILDRVMNRFKKDPKERHNQKVIFKKRLADQRLKMKQIAKDTRNIQSKILELENEMRNALDKRKESQTVLKTIEDIVPDVDRGIVQREAVKYHNLQALVFKQRKSKMLQDIKSGRYRMLFKNDAALSEEFQKEQILRDYLTNVMERTRQDFPLLKNSIQRILLTLEASSSVLCTPSTCK